MMIDYSALTIPVLATHSQNDVAARPMLFQKLAVTTESFGRYPALSPKNILKILENIPVELVPIAARGIGTSYLYSQKQELTQALKILLQKDLNGTVARVVSVANSKLTRDQKSSLLDAVIAKDGEVGLQHLHSFEVTGAQRAKAVEKLINVLATANKVNLAVQMKEQANVHLTEAKNGELVLRFAGRSPEFILRFIDNLKIKREKKVEAIQILREKIPGAFATIQSGVFYNKITNRGSSRLGNDSPLFASVVEKDVSLETRVIAHAQKRTHLFFHLLTAFYKTRKVLALGDTHFQYGKGEKGAKGNFVGAHTSIITSLKVKNTVQDAVWDEAIFFDLYLAHSCNGTYFLPESVNKVDSALEGQNTSRTNKLRQRSLRILQRTSNGEITPDAGMQLYVREFTLVANELKNDENCKAEQKRYLSYQIKGTKQILDAEGKIHGNFFRGNLALSIPETAEFHSILKTTQWQDLTAEFKESLFQRAQQETQAQKVLVVDGKAVH